MDEDDFLLTDDMVTNPRTLDEFIAFDSARCQCHAICICDCDCETEEDCDCE